MTMTMRLFARWTSTLGLTSSNCWVVGLYLFRLGYIFNTWSKSTGI